jgi:hypothetical protein
LGCALFSLANEVAGVLSPDRLIRVFVELCFVLLGGLVIWLGVTRHILFDRRSLGWLAVSIIILFWGARGLFKPAKILSRTENWTRGISLVLLGLLMLAISRAPFGWVGPLLAVVGGLLAVRGLAGVFLILNEKPSRV